MALKEVKKLNELKSFFPRMNISCIEDEKTITLILNSLDGFVLSRKKNFYVDDKYYENVKDRFDQDKDIIFRIQDQIIDDDIIKIDYNFCFASRFKIQFVNCTFKNGISKFISKSTQVEFINCTFENKKDDINSVRISKYEWPIRGKINFDNCKFIGKVIYEGYGRYYVNFGLDFKNCKFNESVELFNNFEYDLDKVSIDNCEFDSDLVIESDVVNISRNNVINGDTNIKTKELDIKDCLLKSKNIFLKTNKSFNSDSYIKADESVIIDGDDTKEYIIFSPKVVLNGHDVSIDNNSLVDVYPNEKYKEFVYDECKVQLERKRLLQALTIIRDSIYRDMEEERKKLEKRLNNRKIKKYIK